MNDSFNERMKGIIDGVRMPMISPALEIDHEAFVRNRNELAGKYDAENLLDYLREQISEFEKEISDECEIGLQLANFGLLAEIHIRSIAFKNPNLIEFVGQLSNGNDVKLIQHISQLNFLLISVPPLADDEPFRIGFGN